MKMKKVYLYGAIALLLIGAAIFFAAFSTDGKTYDYAKKAPGLVTADYTPIDISSITLPVAATDEEVQHKIASLLASKASSTISTTIIPDDYDIVSVVYYGMLDGKVITSPDTMNPSKPTKVQLGSDSKWLAVFGDALTQKPKSYNTVTSGLPDATDILFVTYTVKATETEEEKKVSSEMYQSAADAVAKFGADILTTPIGQEITAGDTYSSVKVDWVARTAYNSKHAHAAGEYMFITVTAKNSSDETLTYYLHTDGTEGNTTLVNKSGTTEPFNSDVLAAILAKTGLKTGDSGNIENLAFTGAEILSRDDLKAGTVYTDAACKNAVEDNSALVPETTYYVKVIKHTYAVAAVMPADPNAEDENIVKAADFTEVAYTYPEDSTEKDNDGGDLKGKTVTYYVIPVGVYNVDVSYTNVSGLSAFTDRADASNLKTAKTAYDTYATKLDALKALSGVEAAKKAYTAYENAVKALTKDTGLKEEDTTDFLAAMTAYLQDTDSKEKEVAYYQAYNDLASRLGDKNKSKLTTCKSTYTTLLGMVKEEGWSDLENSVKDAALVKGAVKDADITAFCEAALAYFPDEQNKEKEIAYYEAYKKFSAKLSSDDKTKLTEYVSALKTLVTRMQNYNVISASLTTLRHYFTEAELEDLLTKLKAHVADEKNEELKTAYEDALKALEDKATDDADLSDADKDKQKAALTSYTDACIKAIKAGQEDKVDANVILTAVVAEVAEQKADWFTAKAKEELNASVRNLLNEERQTEYETEVTKAIWSYLLSDEHTTLKLPSRAVRMAKNEITDFYKQKYYEDEKNYTQYKSFSEYLKATLSEELSDDDTKVTVSSYSEAKKIIRQKAETNVRQLLVIYAMAEKLGVDTEADEIQTYAKNGQTYYYYTEEQRRNAYTMDKVTEILMENLGAANDLYFE